MKQLNKILLTVFTCLTATGLKSRDYSQIKNYSGVPILELYFNYGPSFLNSGLGKCYHDAIKNGSAPSNCIGICESQAITSGFSTNDASAYCNDTYQSYLDGLTYAQNNLLIETASGTFENSVINCSIVYQNNNGYMPAGNNPLSGFFCLGLYNQYIHPAKSCGAWCLNNASTMPTGPAADGTSEDCYINLDGCVNGKGDRCCGPNGNDSFTCPDANTHLSGDGTCVS